MLYDAISGRQITGQWFPATWTLIRTRLTPTEISGVLTGIDQLMIATHDKVTVPGFKAQPDWTGLPWEIVWDKAAHRDFELAGKMLGLLAMSAFQAHPGKWYTQKTHYAGHEFENRFYFRSPTEEEETVT